MNNPFDKLNEYIKQQKKIEKENSISDEECDHNYIEDYTGTFCNKCGLKKNNYTIEEKNNYDTSATYFTYMPNNTYLYGSYNRTLTKNHLWIHNDNSYNFRKKCYAIIDELMLKHNINKKLKKPIMYNINILYCDKDLRFRGNIKISIFIYLIYFCAKELDIDIPLLDILKKEGITHTKYNSALKKIKEEAKLDSVDYIPDGIIKLMKEYNLTIINIIKKYNDFLESEKEKIKKCRKKKLNLFFNEYLTKEVKELNK